MNDEASLAYRRTVESLTLRSIWARAYGDRFWPDGEPPWTMATIDDVQFAMARLNGLATSRFVDAGCGSGCFARLAAETSGCAIDGIDANPLAVAYANDLMMARPPKGGISFRVGDIAATGWPDAHFDGAVSFDVLLFVPDKGAALSEIARILKPGVPFVGTTWELRSDSASLSASRFVDYPAAFAQAEFFVESYAEAPDWRGLLERALSDVVAHEVELRTEIHALSADRLMAWARSRPHELDDARRVRFAVRRQ